MRPEAAAFPLNRSRLTVYLSSFVLYWNMDLCVNTEVHDWNDEITV